MIEQSFELSDYILLGEAALLATGSVAVLALTVRQLIYGGYAGDLSPEEAYQKLVSDSSTVLVDLRTEGDRLESGIPDIRRLVFTHISQESAPKSHDFSFGAFGETRAGWHEAVLFGWSRAKLIIFRERACAILEMCCPQWMLPK